MLPEKPRLQLKWKRRPPQISLETAIPWLKLERGVDVTHRYFSLYVHDVLIIHAWHNDPNRGEQRPQLCHVLNFPLHAASVSIGGCSVQNISELNVGTSGTRAEQKWLFIACRCLNVYTDSKAYVIISCECVRASAILRMKVFKKYKNMFLLLKDNRCVEKIKMTEGNFSDYLEAASHNTNFEIHGAGELCQSLWQFNVEERQKNGNNYSRSGLAYIRATL